MRSICLIDPHFDKHEQKTAYWHQYARQVKTRILPSLSQATRVFILSGRSDSVCEKESNRGRAGENRNDMTLN